MKINTVSSHIISQLVEHLLGDGSIPFSKTSITHILFTPQKDFNIYGLFSNSSRIIVEDILCLMSLFEMVILTFC